MSNAGSTSWQAQFGLNGRNPPEFFSNASELSNHNPQAHLLHRGFDDLVLDGILSSGNTPLVYFKRVKNIDPDTQAQLYRDFWHHGGAPVLVLITDNEVHVYSGLTMPLIESDQQGLVATLDRVTDDMSSLLLSIESGDYFHRHRKFFNPEHRVDRALLADLRDTREQLNDLSSRDIPAHVLDSLLCRLVFTAYLFDRGVIGPDYLRSIGIEECEHLRDVLGIKPTVGAKTALYTLFDRLALDFNGDLFADNLNQESKWIVNKHIDVLSDFFHGTSPKTGQHSFWPYDFGTIPVETISAIYERFLTPKDKEKGAFYTPRFLAEIVLDIALEKTTELIGKTFFDPACGSGIFLVGLFNRLAQQWRSANPRARNDTIARELMTLIKESLFGVDVNPIACRIAAFSIYLAYLDQLSPRDIQQLQEKGRALPRLISDSEVTRNISCVDFFSDSEIVPCTASLVIGNPPWGSIAGPASTAGQWCAQNEIDLPDNQIASAFIRKASMHCDADGHVCLVLPAGTLFNHGDKAIDFQKRWIESNTLECVLNLADYQRFLFESAGHPAIVLRYCNDKPDRRSHKIDYWSPKSDWSATKAEVIRIAAEDRARLSQADVVNDLSSLDAPQIWKRHFWATPRDRRLLDRLSDLPRLRDNVRQIREKSDKRWLIAQGFQPLGPGDDPAEAKQIELPSQFFVEANNQSFDLFLTAEECTDLGRTIATVRKRSSVNTEVFHAPHVLVSYGFTSVAYLDFAASFRHAVRGIHGPEEDAVALAFLAAYFRSGIAKFYLFHTSSNWGITRAKVQDEELLRLPFPFPDSPEKIAIASKIAKCIQAASLKSEQPFSDRSAIVEQATTQIAPFIDEYFGISASERDLINDTIDVVIPSTRPTRSRLNVPTVKQSSLTQRDAFVSRVCELLNGWSKRSGDGVRGQVLASEDAGLAVAILERVDRSLISMPMPEEQRSIVGILGQLREIATKRRAALEFVRGVKVFDDDRLYIVKPLDQRNWTLTAAMNDADEIAGSLLMQRSEQPA